MPDKEELKQVAGPCPECGMAEVGSEFHPHALCLLVKARNGDTIGARKDLAFVMRAARSKEPVTRRRVSSFILRQSALIFSNVISVIDFSDGRPSIGLELGLGTSNRREQWEDELLSDEAVFAVAKRSHPLIGQYTDNAQLLCLKNASLDLQAALASLNQKGGE
jgi:hypothetical protein